MVTFIVATECAIEHRGKFLLIQRPKGKHAEGLLSFPGGKFEREDGAMRGADALRQAVKREVYEEVGLQLEEPIRYVTSSCFMDSVLDVPVVDIVFHCRIDNVPDPLQVALEEVPYYAWLSYDEATACQNCPEWLASYLDLCR